jgi:hypothetical protein
MRKIKWLVGVMLVAMLGFAVPQLAFGQGRDDPVGTPPSDTVPTVPNGNDDPSADDPTNDTSDPSVEPPAVLQDPGTQTNGTTPPTINNGVEVNITFNPPVNELTRFSDDNRSPEWQQRDNWRPRGLFYHRRDGWFVHRNNNWFQWRNRWVPCGQPGGWREDVVRPVPVNDPSPGQQTFSPVENAIAPIQAPRQVSVPQQQDRRAFALRRALRVCQARYVRSIFVLRTLRQHGRITFVQYQRGVRSALIRRAVCRRVVFRLFTIRH